MSLRFNSRIIQRVALKALRLPSLPVQQNPKAQIEKAKRLLAAFDQVPLIYAAADGEILHGEEIWLALKETGATEAEIVFINDKTPTELKAIRLALHRLPADARWIDHNVHAVLADLEANGLDLQLTGFDPPEIDHFLQLDMPKANFHESGSDIPPIESAAVSTAGSIWVCGKHQIGCGSATDLSFVRMALAGDLADACFVDLPRAARNARPRGQKSHPAADPDDEYFALLCAAFAVIKSCCKASALLFACTDWHRLMEVLVAGRASGLSLAQVVSWVKSDAGPAAIYKNLQEFITVFHAGDPPHKNSEMLKRGRNRTDVWNYPSVSLSERRDGSSAERTRIMPVAMIADAVRDCTKRGDLVLDCFVGSGATLMACQETGRVFRGVELDPRYVDAAVRRWEKATGQEAVCCKTGEPFNAAQRRLQSARKELDHGA